MQGPSTSMVRPHPAIWRIMHGMIVIYLLGLVFLLFQDVDNARQLLKVQAPLQGFSSPAQMAISKYFSDA